MANLTMTDREFRSRRFNSYADAMMLEGVGKPEALGVLLLFWDKTRHTGLPEAALEGLAGCVMAKHDLKQPFLNAMMEAGYIKLAEDGRKWTVDGNAEALARRADLKLRTSQPRKPKKATKKAKAKQSDDVTAIAKSTGPERTPFQDACLATWEAYAASFERKTNQKPTRNAKINQQIQQFVQRIGHERSPLVASFYVEHVTDPWIVTKLFPIDVLLKNAEGYDAQCKMGRVVSKRVAKSEAAGAEFLAARQNILKELDLYP